MNIHDLGVAWLAVKLDIAEGRYSEALDRLGKMTSHEEEQAAGLLLLEGQAHEGRNDAARARDAYSRAQSLAPNFAAPLLRQGVLHYRRGDLEAARAFLDRYVRLESGNPEAFFYLCLCEYDADRKAALARKVAILDGPAGDWSRNLLRSPAR